MTPTSDSPATPTLTDGHRNGSFGGQLLAVTGCENLTPASAPRSVLHDPAEPWSPTNCYVDVWIGLLATLELDPAPMLVCALSADFLGEQWEFVKPRHEDLERLYGLRVGEYDTWRPLGEHLREVMARGDALIVEVDAYHLPDTHGVSYGLEHTKTSIVPLRLDPEAGTLVYLHNDGVHELAGEDLHATLGPGAASGYVPFPYVELVRLNALRRLPPEQLWRTTLLLAREHLGRSPDPSAQDDGPAQRLVTAIRDHLPTLAERGMDYFHQYSFATTRQAGLTAALAAHLCRYLARGAHAWPGDVSAEQLERTAEAYDGAATAAKTLQFQLARVASGRTPRIDAASAAFVSAYGSGAEQLRAALNPQNHPGPQAHPDRQAQRS